MQRKAKNDFRSHASETDQAAVAQLWSQAKADLEVAKRQALVYSLYGSKQKSVMVTADEPAAFACSQQSAQSQCRMQDIPMVKVLQKQSEDAPYTTA